MKPLSERRRRSARQTFAACPFRYAAEYLRDVDCGSTPARRGSTFHRARELYIVGLWQERLASDHEIAASALFQANKELPLPHDARLDVGSLWQRWTERYELALGSFVEAESGRRVIDYGCDLRMDEVHALGDTLRIVDCKTHWRMPTQTEADESWQSAMYLAGARKLFPNFSRYELLYDFVRLNATITVTHSQSEMDTTDEVIKEQDAAMLSAEETGVFQATGGAHCGTCLVKCPLVDASDRQTVRLQSAEDAVGSISRLAALYRAEEVERAALLAYCNEHGATTGNGVTWAHRPVERSQYPASRVLDVLHAYGFAFAPMLSHSAVKPLLTSKRKYVAVADEIKALAVTKTQTQFGPRRDGLDEAEREYEES